MSKKVILSSSIFTVISAVIFIISIFFNQTYFEALAYDSVFSYQLRQLAAILLLFIIGNFFLKTVSSTLAISWNILFAFPIGCCLWVFISMLLLLLGIPYTFSLTLLLLVALLMILFFLRYRTAAYPKALLSDMHIAIPFLLLFLGFAFITSSGFIYVFVSYDSYFYFTNYGHTLTILKNFQDIVGENSFTLTNISQFLPLLNSYTAFWGLDQCFQIQAFLTLNVIACFAYGIYQYCFIQNGSSKRAPLISGLFSLLLISSTSFIIVASWVLANMYCMAYIFFLFMVSFLVLETDFSKKDALLIISICFMALTLLRKDGIIFAAFFLICFCSIELFSKKELAVLFLPAVLAELWWLFYVRIVLNAQVSQASFTSIANNKNVFFILLIIICSYIYLLWAHDFLKWLSSKTSFLSEYLILFVGMFCLFLLSFLKKADVIIDNVDFAIRNMFLYPSSWGISGIFFAILLVFSLIRNPKLDYLHFFWSGYAVLNLISYCLVDSKAFWVNWDDSYNRVLLQIVPVFVFIMAVKILPLLQFYIPDRNSES